MTTKTLKAFKFIKPKQYELERFPGLTKGMILAESPTHCLVTILNDKGGFTDSVIEIAGINSLRIFLKDFMNDPMGIDITKVPVPMSEECATRIEKLEMAAMASGGKFPLEGFTKEIIDEPPVGNMFGEKEKEEKEKPITSNGEDNDVFASLIPEDEIEAADFEVVDDNDLTPSEREQPGLKEALEIKPKVEKPVTVDNSAVFELIRDIHSAIDKYLKKYND